MSPSEIRSIVEAVLRDGLAFPWWSYALAFALSMFGAYLGAYVRRKAENRAAQENFEVLRTQLRKTTKDTEEIKSKLFGRAWLGQQQWSIREQRYSELLLHLTKLRLSLQDRDDYFMVPGSEYDESRTEGEHYKQLARRGHASYQAIREHIGPASIFLSKRATEALEELVREHWSIAEFSVCTADYITSALRLVDAAYDAVLMEARSELSRTQTTT